MKSGENLRALRILDGGKGYFGHQSAIINLFDDSCSMVWAQRLDRALNP